MKYITPNMNDSSFNCPHCQVLCPQEWWEIERIVNSGKVFYQVVKIRPPLEERYKKRLARSGLFNEDDWLKQLFLNVCTECGKMTIWFERRVIYPGETNAPLPHKDMPSEVRKVYEEARQVFPYSVRAACALLRLSMEILMDHLKVLTPADSLA